MDYMKALIWAVDALQRPQGASFLDIRRVSFGPPDDLARAIINYTEVWQAFGACLHGYQRWDH